MLSLQVIQEVMASLRQRNLGLVLGVSLAVVGSLLGLSLALVGPIYTLAALLVMAAAGFVMARLEYAIWSVIGIITLLPFATLPIKIVFTPTFLDVAMGAVFFLYIGEWMTGYRRKLTTTPVHAFLLLFIILSIFSFVAGLRYAGLTSRIIRSFAELILSMTFALVLVDVVRTYVQLRRLVLVLLAGGTIAAALGVILWLLPDLLTERILVRLSMVGYPTSDVIRFIEQNPELSERAISTSVNPNALGGLLVMIGGLAVPQLGTRFPITGKHWHVYPVLLSLVLCLILTFSRGSMLAFGVAVLLIAALRYRKLLFFLPAAALLLLVLPWSQVYTERFVAGFQGADLATQMRFGEYRDTFRLITRYPLLGVGFAGTPDIDIYLGVASVYFTLASNMGLLGLTAFLILIVAVFAYAWQARAHLDRVPGLHSIWLGLLAGLISALVNGIFDHYFFNLDFHAAVTIFWMFVGLTLAASRIALEAGMMEQDSLARDVGPRLLQSAG